VHRKFLVVGLMSALAVLPGCVPATTVPAPVTSDVDRLIDSLPLRERIAQLIMPWIPGTYAPLDEPGFAQARMWVDSLRVGGIIVSVGSPLDIAAKLNALQAASPIPLLVASDLESGTTIRLNGGTYFPPNMGVGAGGRELDAYQIGRITALEGRAVGIHFAFAPAVDVNNNPANPIINTRSFGEDPAAVARLGAAAIRGIQEHGMIATAKHFPGHGDTETDSHLSLPVIAASWQRLDSIELAPFRAAIDAGVHAVMSAHIALPGIDGGESRPATVAPNILTGLLRDSLGFRGLTVTDALNMGGVVAKYGPAEATVLAFLAGADLLLMPVNAAEAIDAMEVAVTSGRIPRDRLDASVRRVLEWKKRLGLFNERLVDLDSVMATVGSAEFQGTSRDIAERSIVLAIDDGTVDSLRAAPRRITLVSYGDGPRETVGTTFAAELRSRGHTVTAVRLHSESGPTAYDSARAALSRNPFAAFAVAVRPVDSKGSIAIPPLMNALIDSSPALRPTVLVSFGSPYIVMETPRVRSYLLGWAANPASERAAARALAGAPITGKLPISIPPVFRIGEGFERPATERWALPR
jgi:beta-N-acetylhexosaminidase